MNSHAARLALRTIAMLLALIFLTARAPAVRAQQLCMHSEATRTDPSGSARTRCLQAVLLLALDAETQAMAARELFLHGPLAEALDVEFVENLVHMVSDPTFETLEASTYLRFLGAVDHVPASERATVVDTMLNTWLAIVSSRALDSQSDARDIAATVLTRALVAAFVASPRQPAYVPQSLLDSYRYFLTVSPVDYDRYSELVLVLRRLSVVLAIKEEIAQGYGDQVYEPDIIRSLPAIERSMVFGHLHELVKDAVRRGHAPSPAYQKLADLFVSQALTAGRRPSETLRPFAAEVLPLASPPFRAFAYTMMGNEVLLSTGEAYWRELGMVPPAAEEDFALDPVQLAAEVAERAEEEVYLADRGLAPLVAELRLYERAAHTPGLESELALRFLVLLTDTYRADASAFRSDWAGPDGLIAAAGSRDALLRIAEEERFFATPSAIEFVMRRAGKRQDMGHDAVAFLGKVLRAQKAAFGATVADDGRGVVGRLPRPVWQIRLAHPEELPRGLSVESVPHLLRLTAAVLREVSHRRVLPSPPPLVRDIVIDIATRRSRATDPATAAVLDRALADVLVALGEGQHLIPCWTSMEGACDGERVAEIVVFTPRDLELRGPFVVELAAVFSGTRPCETERNFDRLSETRCSRIYLPRREMEVRFFDPARLLLERFALSLTAQSRRFACTMSPEFGGFHECL